MLKAILLRKKLADANGELAALTGKDYATRESELASAIDEATTPDERKAVEDAVNAFETEKRDFCKREDVSAFLTRVKESGLEKRAISGGALLIPEVVLPMLREVAYKTSKLVKYVAVKPVKGVARQTVAGTIPEAVWTEACGILNELAFSFNGVEVDGYKVGGFVPVCNALLADSDIDLMNAIIEGLGAAIGIALDKAILYGTGVKMPEGIVTRLAQTAQPADYPTTARPWVDLHTSNIKTIANSVHGVDFFKALVDAIANAKSKGYSNGVKFWTMNESTFAKVLRESVSINANGVVSGTPLEYMPVIGGAIEVVGDNVIADNQIVGGYGDLYLLAERAGVEVQYSEHAQFIQDNTVFKGTARYDGLPVIAEGFVVIAIDGATAATSATFAPDTANSNGDNDGEG